MDHKKQTQILEWLKTQGYQTEYEETGEYKMYFELDMPKILNDYYDFCQFTKEHQQLTDFKEWERDKCKLPYDANPKEIIDQYLKNNNEVSVCQHPSIFWINDKWKFFCTCCGVSGIEGDKP